MSEFSIYLQLGLEHILDPNGYDHMLFLVALCAMYKPADWKRVLILATAFTVGHSVTLAMCALGWIAPDRTIVELLIPITIFLTAVRNVVVSRSWFLVSGNGTQTTRNQEQETHVPSGVSGRNPKASYLLALGFGLIHGMGFSSFLLALLGDAEAVVGPLFAFNVGLEIGQIVVVVVFLGIAYAILDMLKVKRRLWILGVSGLAAGISLFLLAKMIFT